jgi:hypothetical protein
VIDIGQQTVDSDELPINARIGAIQLSGADAPPDAALAVLHDSDRLVVTDEQVRCGLGCDHPGVRVPSVEF